MRIIAGIFRGKKIIQPNDNKTRPLKDLVKESIFNIIHHSNKLSVKIENSLILDLFSGVGSFGLECLSRGASFVFLDPPYKEKNIFEIINKIIDQNILNKNGLIIIHRHKNEIDKLPEKLKIVEEKKYGIAKIIFAKI